MAQYPEFTEQTFNDYRTWAQFHGQISDYIVTFDTSGLQEQIDQNASDIQDNTDAIDAIVAGGLPAPGDPFQALTLDETFLTPKWTTIDNDFVGSQPVDDGLTSIAALVTSADKMIYTTALDVYTTTDITSFARTLIDDISAAAMRTTLGLVIGTDVQAWSSNLDSINQDLGTGNDVKFNSVDIVADLKLQRLTGSLFLPVAKFADTLSGAQTNNLSIGNNGGASLILHTNSTAAITYDLNHDAVADGDVTQDLVTRAISLNNVLDVAAAKEAGWVFKENGTSKWQWTKSTGNDLFAFNFATSKVTFRLFGSDDRAEFAGRIISNDTTDSTSVSTGSGVFAGGFACVKSAFIGAKAHVGGDSNEFYFAPSLGVGGWAGRGGFELWTDTNNNDSSASAMLKLHVGVAAGAAGGVIFDVTKAGDGLVSGDWEVQGTTDSTSTTTGSGQFDGGVGIVKNLHVGGATNLGGTLDIGGVEYTFPVADGTSGFSLTTNGSGTLSWTNVSGGGGGGHVELLQVVTVGVAQTNIDLDLDGDHDYYDIVMSCVPTTDGANLHLQVTEDGFTTVESGATDYTWYDRRIDMTVGGTANTRDADDSLIQLATNIGNGTGEFFQGSACITFPSDGNKPTFVTSDHVRVNNAAQYNRGFGGGSYKPVSIVDGVRILWSAGDHGVGTKVYVYGYLNTI